MSSTVNKIDVSQLYEHTIYVLVTVIPSYPKIRLYPGPFLVSNNGIYRYYIGDERYEVSEYL